MRPQKQLIGHKPSDGRWGDCYRTCIAIIMDMDAADVPHFCEDGSTSGADACRAWLKQFGMTHWTTYHGAECVLPDILRTHKALNPDVPYILTAAGPRGCNHSVVVLNGKIFCDPYSGKPNPEALIGPAKGPDGDCYWWIEVIAMVYAQ